MRVGMFVRVTVYTHLHVAYEHLFLYSECVSLCIPVHEHLYVCIRVCVHLHVSFRLELLCASTCVSV